MVTLGHYSVLIRACLKDLISSIVCSEIFSLRSEFYPNFILQCPRYKWRWSSQAQKIGNIETVLTDSDGPSDSSGEAVQSLQAENIDLKLKLDDLENHLRRQNVRAIGIPEGSEGQKSGDFYVLNVPNFGEGAFERPPKNLSSPPYRAKIPTQRIP